jgi:ribonuclease M5
MRRIEEAVVVEGRYDKSAVRAAVECCVITTSGFGIFHDKEKLELLRTLAVRRGIILLMDSDGAGFVIRGRLRGMIGQGVVKHAYIPDTPGRERRKRTDSGEGKLGVEAMGTDIIIRALERAGATFSDSAESSAAGIGSEESGSGERGKLTKVDMFELGLCGGDFSAGYRTRILTLLALPSAMSANAMLDIVNALYTRDEFIGFLRLEGARRTIDSAAGNE